MRPLQTLRPWICTALLTAARGAYQRRMVHGKATWRPQGGGEHDRAFVAFFNRVRAVMRRHGWDATIDENPAGHRLLLHKGARKYVW